MALIQPLNNYIINEISKPDVVNTEHLLTKNINTNHVISRDENGNVLSRYTDDIWDLSTYKTTNRNSPFFDFNEYFPSNQKNDAKKIFFLIYCYGSGRNSSSMAVSTLKSYFKLLSTLAEYSSGKNIKIENLFFEEYYILDYIKNHMSLSKAKNLLSLLNLIKNKSTHLKYKESKKILNTLQIITNNIKKNQKQTLVIPSRIFNNSIKERWKQINEIENNLQNITKFLYNYISSPLFAYNDRNNKNKKNSITWNSAVKKFKLNKLFSKYNIKERQNFNRFYSQIQGTCYQIILAYSGMRDNECLSLNNNCLEILDNNTYWLNGYTSKLEGQKKAVKWVTSKEIKKVINILNSLNSPFAEIHNLKLDDLPLFIGGGYILSKIINVKTIVKTSFKKYEVLPINNNNLKITQEDLIEIRNVDFSINDNRLKIEEYWNFTSHQYRRSLAIYAIQSGKVSLGALQKQFKHLFREMTFYYAEGSNFAKKLFEDGISEHISNDMKKIEPELQALSYIKEVLFSEEEMYGLHGKLIEKNFKKDNNITLNNYLLKNRSQTLKKFQNGEIAYKPTALGGCVSTEACDSRLTRSITACFNCHGGILKKSKVYKVIKKQKEFIEFLDKDSIEYKTEIEDLEILKNMNKKLIGEKHE